MHTRRRLSRFGAAAATLAFSAVLLGLSPGGAAAEEDDGAGHVYVLNHSLSGTNLITIFGRASDGRLTRLGATDIGGRGSVAAFAEWNAAIVDPQP